jgi:MarR family transcriptional regulator, organic hydroperoxide resistance regulator
MGKLQAEIRQSKPFETLEQEAELALERTTDQLRRHYDEFFKRYELTGTQYNALRILRGAGADGLPCSEIGLRMVTRDPDITRLLSRLEKRDLCARGRDKKDRRVILSRITPTGLKLLQEIDRPIRELNKSLLKHMSESRLRSLIHLLDQVRDGCEQRPEVAGR